MPHEDNSVNLENILSLPVTHLRKKQAIPIDEHQLNLVLSTEAGREFEAVFTSACEDDKYILALSPTAGCPAGCNYCQLGQFGYFQALSPGEIVEEGAAVLQTAKEMNYDISGRPLKFSFVQGGDVLFNERAADGIRALTKILPVKGKISTVAPKTRRSKGILRDITDFSFSYQNPIQLQFSLLSTDGDYRQGLVRVPLMSFYEIREMGEYWMERTNGRRKANLTFTLTDSTPCSPQDILDILPPEIFTVRLRRYRRTDTGDTHLYRSVSADEQERLKKRFEDAGYKVIIGNPTPLEDRFEMQAGQTLQAYLKWQLKNGADVLEMLV